jgi:hypothetical protein
MPPADAGKDSGIIGQPLYGAVVPPEDAGDDAGDGGLHVVPLYGAAPSPTKQS